MKAPSLAAVGRYEILGEIGRGAMGVVYKARDPHIGRIVAIKTITVLDLEPLDQKEYRERFNQEARTAGRLSHPGIVTIFDVGVDAETDIPYIVMEYVDGQPLSQVQESEKGRLPMGSALRLTEEVAEALHYAHSEGVIHRDIKPANILVTAEGHAKIADFGIARFNQSHLTLPGRVLGSPAFMSPEQLEGETADRRSDLFSLGVVLYTILTGHRPFQGNSTATVCFKLMNRDPLPVSAWDLDLPLNLDDLLAKALAKDPDNRFQTGNEMAFALEEFRRAHEFDAEPLADIARIIDRPPLVTQQIVIRGEQRHPQSIDLEPLALEPIDLEPLEKDIDNLHAAVDRALAVRSKEKGNAPPVALAPPTPIAIAPATPKKGVLATFPTPSKPAPKPRTWIGAVTAFTATILLASAFWYAHSHGTSPAQAEAPPAIAPQVPEQAQQPQATSSNDTAGEAPSTVTRPAARASSQAPVLSAKTIQPNSASASPARFKSHASVAMPAAPAASPSEITVQKMELANLDVSIEHGFGAGEASVSIDHHQVMERELKGENKRRALLFKKTEGHDSGTLTLLPGTHDIEVHVKSPDGDFDLTKTLSRGFAPGSKAVLLVICDKRKKKLELLLQ